MKILTVCSEYAPLAKTGGLADAVAGLTKALVGRGHDVRVLLPRYSFLPGQESAANPLRDRSGRFAYFEGPNVANGPCMYLLELDGAPRPEIYLGDERDAVRFLQLCAAVAPLIETLDWKPDVLHCHDWQTALVPALPSARELPPTVLTIHNMGHQGAYGVHVLAQNGFADLSGLVDPRAPAKRAINYLRAGIAAATAITTVSPTYAREICSPEHGMGLEGHLSARAADLFGILNGVDYAIWSPEQDPFLVHRFDRHDMASKASLKAALCADLGLDAARGLPLIVVVSRIEKQKGIDLFIGALPRLVRETSALFAVHGRGREELTSKLERFARKYAGRFAFTNGYDESLAHRLLAAGDMLLMPSRYEPCGLTQLYALRYGTVPIVRATGGLADTIEPFDSATGRGTGSVFHRAHADDLHLGIRRALEWFNDRRSWAQLVANCMAADFSWEKPAQSYEAVYRRAISCAAKAC